MVRDLAQQAHAYKAKLRRRAQKLCRDDAQADDLVQETFTRALTRIDSLGPNPNVLGWLLTIMTNLFRDGLKRKHGCREVPLESVQEIASEVPMPPRYPALECEQVLEAIKQLPQELSTVLTLKVIDGLRYREIAERLGIPPNTVGTRLFKARELLFEKLGMDKP